MSQILKLLQDFLESLESSTTPATIKNYNYYLNRFFQWADISDTQKITFEKIENFKNSLSNTGNNRGDLLKSSTQNYHLIAIRSFLDYCQHQNIETLKPQQIYLNKSIFKKSTLLQKSDLGILLDAPLSSKNAEILINRDKAILELLFRTGLKVSEISSLKKNHINFFDTKLTIKDTKKNLRTVLFPDQTKIWIKKYLDLRSDNIAALFIRHDKAKTKQLTSTDKDGYQLTPRTIQRIVKKYVKSSGLDRNITPETLRRAHAGFLKSEGFDLKTIQSMMGHTSLASTKLSTKK